MAGKRELPVAIVFGAWRNRMAICQRYRRGRRASFVVGYNTSAANAEALAKSLVGEGHSARRAPVTDTAALAQMAEGIASDYGRCDAIVNTAREPRAS